MAVTLVSRHLCNHVLLRVHHLTNKIVVVLDSCVFSSLAKLPQFWSLIITKKKKTHFKLSLGSFLGNFHSVYPHIFPFYHSFSLPIQVYQPIKSPSRSCKNWLSVNSQRWRKQGYSPISNVRNSPKVLNEGHLKLLWWTDDKFHNLTIFQRKKGTGSREIIGSHRKLWPPGSHFKISGGVN